MKKFKYVCLVIMIIFISITTILIVYNHHQNATPIADSIIDYINSSNENQVIISLSDFTNFDWDKVLIYNYPTTKKEIETALDVKYEGSTDLTSGMIFVKNNKIVNYEYFDISFETTSKFIIYPYTDIHTSIKYCVLSKDEAIFIGNAKKSKLRYYRLYPTNNSIEVPT